MYTCVFLCVYMCEVLYRYPHNSINMNYIHYSYHHHYYLLYIFIILIIIRISMINTIVISYDYNMICSWPLSSAPSSSSSPNITIISYFHYYLACTEQGFADTDSTQVYVKVEQPVKPNP